MIRVCAAIARVVGALVIGAVPLALFAWWASFNPPSDAYVTTVGILWFLAGAAWFAFWVIVMVWAVLVDFAGPD